MGALPAENPAEAAGVNMLDAYLRSLEVERNYSAHTLRSYRTDLNAYYAWCEREGLAPLHPGRRGLRAYLGYLSAAGYARTTINRHLSAVRGFFGWLVETGRLDSDPTTTLTGLKRQKRLPRRIAPAEMARILAVHGPREVGGKRREQTPADLRDQMVLELFYASGCRISEAAGLHVGDIDFGQSLLRLFGKGGKERIVPLHEISVGSVRSYLCNGRPHLLKGSDLDGLLLVSNAGKPYSPDAIRKMFRQTLVQAGVDAGYTPHDMRHTFASDMLEGGADLRSVQELLGHASPSTTQIYTHLSPSYLKDVHRQAHPRG